MAISITPNNLDKAALEVAGNFDESQKNLLSTYTLKQDATAAQLKAVAKDIGAAQTNLSVQGLQMLAKERFERNSQILTLFSSMLEKVSQMRDAIIRKIGR